jgi:hypothetical protein
MADYGYGGQTVIQMDQMHQKASQQVVNPVIQAFSVLFGRSPRQIAIMKGQEIPQEKYSSFESIENRLSKIFTGYADLQYDRASKYRDYDRMDSASTEAQTGLDIYAEEASQKDDKTGFRVWVEAKDKKLEQDLNQMIQRIRMEYKAYGVYRNLAKHGDCFLYMLLGGFGVHDVQFVHPSRIERVQEDGLLGFKAPQIAQFMPSDNKAGLFKPWDFVHFRVTAFDQESVYGRSFLEGIRKTWKQLSMLETMVVLYRISKAVQRNIFYVDVGQASLTETAQIVKDYEKFLKNKTTFVDPKTNEFKLDFNPATILQDIVWPTRPGSTSKVEQLQNTTNIGPVDDLEYWKTKMRIGLNIPKDYFDGEVTGAWNSKEALMLQDVRFSRKITKLQDAFREGMIRICQIHHAITKQQYLPPDQFIVQLGTISSIAERQREEILLRKAQIFEILANIAIILGWNRWQWGDYLLDEIFPLPAELRAKLMTPDPVQEMEFKKQKELGKMGAAAGKPGGGPGGKKPGSAPKPQKKVTADNLKMGLRSFGYGNEPKKTEGIDGLEFNGELMEEFQEVAEDIITNNVAEEIAYEKIAPYLLSLQNDEQKWINSQVGLGFGNEDLEELCKTKEKPKSLIDSSDPDKQTKWKKLHEMGISPEFLEEGQSYEDDPLDTKENLF